jgi:hypothetical protein
MHHFSLASTCGYSAQILQESAIQILDHFWDETYGGHITRQSDIILKPKFFYAVGKHILIG